MRKHTRGALVLSALVITLVAAAALPAAERDVAASADGYLTEEERGELVKLLESSQRELLERVADLGDAAFTYKPSPDRWSIAQILEHLVLAEESFFGNVEAAMAADPDPQWASETAGKEDRLYRVVPIRVQRFQAPEGVQPKGERNRRDLVMAYEKLRSKSIGFIRDASEPIKAHTTENAFLGRLGAHQWMLLAALHNLRHNQQVVEVMADPSFPH